MSTTGWDCITHPVEQNERLLPHHNKEGIDELKRLGQNEEGDPKPGSPKTVLRIGPLADGVLKPVQIDVERDLWDNPDGAGKTEERQKEIPRAESPVQSEGRPVFHNCPATETKHDVEGRESERDPPKVLEEKRTAVALRHTQRGSGERDDAAGRPSISSSELHLEADKCLGPLITREFFFILRK